MEDAERVFSCRSEQDKDSEHSGANDVSEARFHTHMCVLTRLHDIRSRTGRPYNLCECDDGSDARFSVQSDAPTMGAFPNQYEPGSCTD
jgi:hypothetical protein